MTQNELWESFKKVGNNLMCAWVRNAEAVLVATIAVGGVGVTSIVAVDAMVNGPTTPREVSASCVVETPKCPEQPFAATAPVKLAP
jgi:hypothetical protein